jgi:TolB-like protein/Tfp pilus assembly protein PilF
MSAAGDQEYMSDGIAEELLNLLAKVPQLRVISRSSAFSFKGKDIDIPSIAEQLNVAHILEGSVRKAGNTIRITAQLIEARSDTHLWSETYDRKLDDIFAIQDEIATAIVAALRAQLTLQGTINPSAPRAASIDAYNLYLLGRYHFKKRTIFELQQAQRYFESAIERDPGYAPAYNGLVDSILMQSDAAYGTVPVEQAIAAALPLIEKSLELDPLLAETHASLGLLRMLEWDLLASEAALKRATELNPNLSQAFVWLYITYERAVQPKSAFETLQRAFALDPLSLMVNSNMAAEFWIRSRTHEALQAANRIIQIAPDGPIGFRRTGRIKWTSGELAEAVSWYRQSIELAPEDRNSKLELGALLVDLGVYDEAESLLDDQRYIAYLAQGRVEEALAIVRTSLEERPEHLSTIFAAAHAEARAGNYDRVRLLLEPHAEGAKNGEGSLFLRSGIHFWDPQIAAMDLAVALLETSDREAGLALLSEVRTYFAFLRSEGLEHPMLSFQEARILALEGRPDEALGVLRQIIAAGWRFWYLDGDPALRNLREGREFRSIVNDLNMLIEQERAEFE